MYYETRCKRTRDASIYKRTATRRNKVQFEILGHCWNVKCRNTTLWEKGRGKDAVEEPPKSLGLLLGDFTANKQSWMRERSSFGIGLFEEDTY